MRNKLFCAAFFCMCVFLVSASSPSLDGRAVVADKNVLPAGLFAKTVGYLPGDSVSVTNPVSGKTVEVLVIGSLDPSEGVAILLTPEAASALGIEKNSNNLVKLTKRSGQLDEIVSGTAVIARAPDESGTPEEEAPVPAEVPAADTSVTAGPADIAESTTPGAVPAETEESVADASEPSAGAKEPVVPETLKSSEITEIPPAVEQESPEPSSEQPENPSPNPAAHKATDVSPVPEIVSSTEIPEDEAVPAEPAAGKTEETSASKIPVENQPAENKITDTVPAEPAAVPVQEEPVVPDSADTTSVESPAVAEPITPEAVPQQSDIAAAKTLPEAPTAEPVATEPVASGFETESENLTADVPSEKTSEVPPDETQTPAAERIVAEIPPSAQKSNAGTEKIPSEPPAEDITQEKVEDAKLLEPISDEPEVKIVTGNDSEMEENAEAYQPILLTPSALNPPSAADETTLPPDAAVQPEDATSAAEPVVSTTQETVPADGTQDFSHRLVEKLGDLKSGMYYVQIAVLRDTGNVKNLIDTYGKNYPVVLVPTVSNTSYQVMIGPLNGDEYGSILLRFRDHGFKDAFLRKIH
ncbi:MAG: hypothetical protein LKF96_01140 [Treponema sp.]|jgi:hypothetical protein|nr:hypothetical protein [Treponema sp.]